MNFTETPLKGAYLIELQKREDDRGFFSRAFCRDEFDKYGLNSEILQINNSLSKDKGTLRGMHYQLAPMAEDKMVRCIKGALFDVIIDLRPESETYCQWFGQTLSAENRTMMYVPKGFAHGFLTLEKDTEAFYMVTEKYGPERERGIRYNDPKFNIQWPAVPQVISEKDLLHPDFDEAIHLH